MPCEGLSGVGLKLSPKIPPPQFDCFITARRGETLTVGMKGKTSHRILVTATTSGVESLAVPSGSRAEWFYHRWQRLNAAHQD